MDARAVLDRVLALPPVAFGREVLDAYGSAAGGLLANGLAYAALFASLPTTLLMLGIAGFLTSDASLQQELADSLTAAFPPLGDVIDEAVTAVSNGAGISSILGLVGLVWGVSQFYGALDTAFARIFSLSPERDLGRRTLRGFLWVLALVSLVLAAVVVGTISSLVAEIIPGRAPTAKTVADILSSPLAVLALAIAIVAIAYRVLPARAPGWRSILPFAVVVGIVIALLTQAFGLLVPFLVGRAAVAGSLAAAFIALAWLSFVFQALLLGATCVRIADERRAPG